MPSAQDGCIGLGRSRTADIWLERRLSRPPRRQMGYGGVLGFCTGLACKKIGQSVAEYVGCLLLLLQLLALRGYITIHWTAVKADFDRVLSAGSAAPSGDDPHRGLRALLRRVFGVMPAGCGFVPGFYVGFVHVL